MYVEDFDLLFESEGFMILHKDKDIVVVRNSVINYFSDEDVIFKCKENESIDSKDVIKILSTKKLPKKLKKFVKDRARNLIGSSFEIYTNKDKYNIFFTNPSAASLYGVKNDEVEKIKLTIEDTFTTQEDFDSSFKEDEQNRAFGVWDIGDNEVCSSFVYTHPLQTKMCFPDFGKKKIDIGSLYVKMRVDV